jgi:hypothetical protein
MFSPSADGNTHVFSAHQDVAPRMDINKELRKMYRPKKWGEGRRVASIPTVVWEHLQREGIADNPKRLKKWLNDPDNKAFRTLEGRV